MPNASARRWLDRVARQRPVAGAAHEVVDVAVDVHVDRVRAAGRQRAADDDRGHQPRATARRAAASTMVGTVVTSSSSMIRGFVSAMYARTVSIGPGSARGGCATAHLGRPQAAGAQQQPDRCAPQRRADRQVRHDEEARTGATRRSAAPSAICTTTSTTSHEREAPRQRRLGRRDGRRPRSTPRGRQRPGSAPRCARWTACSLPATPGRSAPFMSGKSVKARPA